MKPRKFGLLKRLRRFRKRERGTSTIEFVVILPLYILIVSIAFEIGLMTMRQAMLNHAMDVTVRFVRIGLLPEPTHDNLINTICANALFIPDCPNQVRLEMRLVSIAGFDASNVGNAVQCRDRTEAQTVPLTQFTNVGGNNDLMFLQACALLDPLLPNFAYGQRISANNGGFYALTTSSAYVMEPFQ